MTDLEITRLCAEAMGLPTDVAQSDETGPYLKCSRYHRYQPLHDDAQAMALVKRFSLAIQPPQFVSPPRWHVWRHPRPSYTGVADILNLNRAICECVAKMRGSNESSQPG